MNRNEKQSLRMRSCSKRGLTLVEVFVAIGIFGLFSFGLLGSLVQSRYMTEGSIRQNLATSIAQGYIEQIKNMEFRDLDEPVINTMINQGAQDFSLTVSPTEYTWDDNGETHTYVVPLEYGCSCDTTNVQLFDIHNTPDDDADDMALETVLYIKDITNEGSGIGNARLIAIRYTYTESLNGKEFERSNTLYNIKSEVPTF